MVGFFLGRRQLAGAVLLLGVITFAGCRKNQGSDTGKTYTAAQKNQSGGTGSSGSSGGGGAKAGGKAGGGSGSGGGGSNAGSGGSSDNAPLNTPADTANYKASPASDSGTSQAVQGQVVAEPGAPSVPAGTIPAPPKGGGNAGNTSGAKRSGHSH